MGETQASRQFSHVVECATCAVWVRKNIDCHEISAVAAVVEYRQATEYEGSKFLFPSVVEGGEKGSLALMPAQMTTTS